MSTAASALLVISSAAAATAAMPRPARIPSPARRATREALIAPATAPTPWVAISTPTNVGERRRPSSTTA